jgi:hypothetical protein
MPHINYRFENGENEWQCFFGCKNAQEVWIEFEFWERMHDHKIEHVVGFKQLIFHLIESMDNKSVSHVAMLLWSMDDLVAPESNMCWNDKMPSVFEVRCRTWDSLEDWLKVRSMAARQQPAITHETERNWCRPTN